MVDQSLLDGVAGLVTPPQGHLQRVEDQLGALGGGRGPAHDGPRVQVDDERDVHDAGPGGHASEVGYPAPVRGRGGEVAPQQVGRPRMAIVGDGGTDLPATPHPGDAQLAHQPLHGAPGDRDALPAQLAPDLERAVDLVVGLPDPQDLVLELPVAHRPLRRRSTDGGVVGARCDLRPVLAQHSTDRLDTKATLMLVNESHELRCAGLSSSAAKKAEAARRISLARRSSRTSARSRRNSADSSLLTPGRRPASISA